MQLARVRGNVVASVKESGLTGYKMLLLETVAADNPEHGTAAARCEHADASAASTYVAIDLVGAGVGEIVLVVFGGAARVSAGAGDGYQTIPTDAAVVAIVDSVQFDGNTTYFKR